MVSDLIFRLRSLFRRESVEAEIDEELRAHFEKQVEKYAASGLPRGRRQFGEPGLHLAARNNSRKNAATRAA
jgi:hypothetical protein